MNIESTQKWTLPDCHDVLVYIGMGSNLQNPLRQIAIATERLEYLPSTTVDLVSSCYKSSPMGPDDQPDFINRVVSLKTSLGALQLLDCLQTLEAEQGRVRGLRWGPRVIDLDILLFGNQMISTERLTVPHYGLKERLFFLYPLAEIAADLILPDGARIMELIGKENEKNCNLPRKL